MSKYQTRDREELLGHLWADYGLQRQARALADTPQYNTLLSMDDCEVFRSADCPRVYRVDGVYVAPETEKN